MTPFWIGPDRGGWPHDPGCHPHQGGDRRLPSASGPFGPIFLHFPLQMEGKGGDWRPPPSTGSFSPHFLPFSYKNGGKGRDRRPPPASGPFSPLYILEPNKGDSHLIQDDTPHIGYDRLGWLGWLATWSGIPPLICVEPDMRNGQWIRDAILILDRTR